ncbi:MAG: hypothetical protein HKL80_00010 [Acidimicrobiales bacterium]|nr:hypothetical protein [Acidimicrobiales bacterium]
MRIYVIAEKADQNMICILKIRSRVVIPFFLFIAFILIPANNAMAVGSSNLESLIISNPYPSMPPLDTASLQNVVDTLQKMLKDATNSSVNVAAEGWKNTSNNQSLLVLVSSFGNANYVNLAASNEEVSTFCATAGAQASGSPAPVSGIPMSAELQCSANGSSYDSISFGVANVFVALDFSNITAAETPTPDALASSELAMIPANGIAMSSPLDWPLVIGVIVGAGAFVGVGLYLLFRAKKTARVRNAIPVMYPGYGMPSGGYQPYGSQPPYGYASQPSLTTYETHVAEHPAHLAGQYFVATDNLQQGLATPGPFGYTALEIGWYDIEGNSHRKRYWDGTSWTSYLEWDGTQWKDSA